MRMRLITDEDFKVTLVASALSHAQQDAVARILDQDPMPAGTYNILKTELLRLHEKSAWDRVAELFAMPAMGGQTASELLAAMRNLQPPQPDEEELCLDTCSSPACQPAHNASWPRPRGR